MNSIRTKTTILTVFAIVVAMIIATVFGVISIQKIGTTSSEELLFLLCETGEKNLDAYFTSVEQSVEIVSSFITSDISGNDTESFEAHMKRAREIFEKTANKTAGVLTFYYRIDPAFSDTVKGFWYTDLDGNGFVEHEVTDISLYDVEDTSNLVWFTVPRSTGKAIWLPPYITDNLDVRVISYNVPIYWNDSFVGVVGIEIDYSTIAQQVDNIKLYENGYAFINDEEGNIIYHPRIDVLAFDEQPKVPDSLLGTENNVRYKFEGVEKQAVWLKLNNGMRLNVTVPTYEINGNWEHLITETFVVSIVIVIVFIIVTLRFTEHITKPLRELTEVAEQVDEGNYDVELRSTGDDEVGILARTFNKLIRHLRVYINDLNSLAYADALTSVHNKGAYDIYIRELQSKIDDPKESPEFAIGIFDCDDLKSINDSFGHDKGDLYLKNASKVICGVFQHSPVFRIGGDEFAVIIQNGDLKIMDELVRRFEEQSAASCVSEPNRWDQVRVSLGIAKFDPSDDRFVDDVARRADKQMYEQKRLRKVKQETTDK